MNNDSENEQSAGSSRDGFPEDEPHPSTIFSLWPDADPPLEEEIRLALRASFPETQRSDDVEGGDETLWGGVFRLPDGTEMMIWAEPRGDLSDEFLAEALGDGPELDAAQRARWVVGVEAFLDPSEANRSFQRQLQVVDVVTVPDLVAIYDENAVVVRSGRLVQDLAWCPVPPRASTLYAVHSVAGYGGSWLHTHGLSRTGLPEIDLLGVPDSSLAEGFDLLDGVADVLLAGDRPDAHGHLVVGENVIVRALPLDVALRSFSNSQAGGRHDREGNMADHAGHRYVLMDVEAEATPKALLERLRVSGALYKSRQETERQRSLSRKRWGTFGQLFVLNRGRDWRFHVKLAYERKGDPTCREHLWFEVLELRPGGVKGKLVNEPLDVPELSMGVETWEPLNRLTDWLIITPQGIYDPEVAPGLLTDG